jgi:hypothetical protein
LAWESRAFIFYASLEKVAHFLFVGLDVRDSDEPARLLFAHNKGTTF